MKLDNMKVEDVKKLKSCLYKLLDNELKLYNFKFCNDDEHFNKLISNAHESIVSLIIGFFNCYVLYVDLNFNIFNDGIPFATEIEKDLIKKYYEEWQNDKIRKR